MHGLGCQVPTQQTRWLAAHHSKHIQACNLPSNGLTPQPTPQPQGKPEGPHATEILTYHDEVMRNV